MILLLYAATGIGGTGVDTAAIVVIACSACPVMA